MQFKYESYLTFLWHGINSSRNTKNVNIFTTYESLFQNVTKFLPISLKIYLKFRKKKQEVYGSILGKRKLH